MSQAGQRGMCKERGQQNRGRRTWLGQRLLLGSRKQAVPGGAGMRSVHRWVEGLLRRGGLGEYAGVWIPPNGSPYQFSLNLELLRGQASSA